METAAPRPRVEALELTGFAHPTPARPAPEAPAVEPAWPLWQRVLFRFFFVYFLLRVAPWNWFSAIPGVVFVLRYYGMAVDWAVRTSNAQLLPRSRTLVPVNGSGDTS